MDAGDGHSQMKGVRVAGQMRRYRCCKVEELCRMGRRETGKYERWKMSGEWWKSGWCPAAGRSIGVGIIQLFQQQPMK